MSIDKDIITLEKIGIPRSVCNVSHYLHDLEYAPTEDTYDNVRRFLSSHEYTFCKLAKTLRVTGKATFKTKNDVDIYLLVVPDLECGFFVPLDSENRYYVKMLGIKKSVKVPELDINLGVLLASNWLFFDSGNKDAYGNLVKQASENNISNMEMSYRYGCHPKSTYGLTIKLSVANSKCGIFLQTLALGDLFYLTPYYQFRKKSTRKDDIPKVTDILALVYNNKLVGYRFVGENKFYDTDLQTSTRLGIQNLNVKNKIILAEYKGLLVSKAEITDKQVVVDVSDNLDIAKALFSQVLPTERKY